MGGHYIDRKADPHWRCKKRIAELEARVKELEIERGANQEEIVRLKGLLREAWEMLDDGPSDHNHGDTNNLIARIDALLPKDRTGQQTDLRYD